MAKQNQGFQIRGFLAFTAKMNGICRLNNPAQVSVCPLTLLQADTFLRFAETAPVYSVFSLNEYDQQIAP